MTHTRRFSFLSVAFALFAVVAVSFLPIAAPASAGESAVAAPASATPAAISGFSDVARSHPFWLPISWMVAKGITNGYSDGTYQPTASVTRQSIAAFLNRYSGSPGSACSTGPFVDVPVDHPFCKQIKWLAGIGATTGYPDGTFRPSDSVTRQSFAAILYRVAGSPNGQDPTCSSAPFSDVPADHPFCGEIKWLVSKGITGGYSDGTFQPTAPVSRQSAAAFLHRYKGAPVKVASGIYNSCAAMANGIVKCWGRNDTGQLGDGTTTNRSTPTPVSGLSDAVDVDSGFGHTCAVRRGGQVLCWGANSFGQIGDGSTTNRSVPTAVYGISDAVKVLASYEYSCAILKSGAMKCWGANSGGKLGNGNNVDSTIPVAVSGISGAVDVTGGLQHTCALLSNGTVKCWGDGSSGQLGNGTLGFSFAPVSVSGISDAISIGGGRYHTCVARAGGTVRCWGANGSGQIGDGTTVNRSTPTIASGVTSAVAVSSEGDTFTSCAVLSSGAAKCWGSNTNGAIGNGTQGTDVVSPANVAVLTDAIQMSAGNATTCSLGVNGVLRCWGRNYEGQIGDGTLTVRVVPVTVTGYS